MISVLEINQITKELLELEEKRNVLLINLKNLTQKLCGESYPDAVTEKSSESQKYIFKSWPIHKKSPASRKGKEIEGTRRWHIKQILRNSPTTTYSASDLVEVLISKGLESPKRSKKKLRESIGVDLAHAVRANEKWVKRVGASRSGRYQWRG